ncbi:hypothetical protein NEMBOFW57_003540 [Staphylotrichum longicolle]|uniref:MICOS complex subunit MIC60 n=1 Tax=Staphylotrichum longicolle TaxID=669026 RepID=A0AAD4F5G3_9PEZI|nr:hypothetical protein NEMBOFW57_003540 [Staphylotrichum longicolle]
MAGFCRAPCSRVRADPHRAVDSPPPPPPVENIAASTIPPEKAPLTPPAPATTIPPPPPPPVPRKKKGFFRRLRNYLLTLTLLGALAFGGGVWYSRINDNFHDFFTEYIPYGEQAVLYLEELDFKKRFPNVASRVTGRRPDGEQVKVPPRGGASWRVADGSEPAARTSSAIQKSAAVKEVKPKAEPVVVAQAKEETAKLPKAEAKAEDSQKPVAVPVVEKKPEPVPEPAPRPLPRLPLRQPRRPSRRPKSTSPRAGPGLAHRPARRPNAADPVVQDLVRMLNDIIAVINHDGANEKYGPTIGKAKGEISKVGQKIRDLKTSAEEEAAQQVKKRVEDFDKAANELVSRLDSALAAQEQQFRREFEAEIQRLKQSYDSKVQLIQERERRLAEEKLNNQLLEQAVQLQRQFARDIKQHVEEERGGRLGKLTELANAVDSLEKLTAGWNDVIDANLRTQQLHVAVEAVRASLEDAHHPRPFIKELVALKEIAAHDGVVDAAIASIHPSAYQRGIATPAELIDRFRRVAGEVRKASLLPDDAGVASHASSYVLSKVLFKKQGLAAGDDVESILTRTQTFLEEGDLDNAAREMNGLTGWSKTLSRDWLAEVRKVLEVRQALEVIQTEARLQSLKMEASFTSLSYVSPNPQPPSEAYTTALHRLALLQSNRAITSLFEPPAPADGPAKKDKKDLNALAIPEMLAWLRRANLPPSALTSSPLRCVHVAGTKGKGSVSALVAAILRQYSPSSSSSSRDPPVGLYTSPHVLSVRERICLDGAPVPEEVFARYVNRVWEDLTEAARAEAARRGVQVDEEELAGAGTKPFYFRFLTIVALRLFLGEGVRSAVVECGIGGEYDSTNVLPREVVTGGGDAEIAWHKSGVFKEGVKGFTRRLRGEQEGVMEVLRARAMEKGAELVEVEDEEVERWEGVEGAKLQGPFQRYNMALAVYAAREHLLQTGVKLEGKFGSEEWSLSDIPAEFVKGLKEAALRGRCEVVEDADGTEWHVDGAHTDDSLAGVGTWFAGKASGDSVKVLVFNQQERDPAPLLRALLAGQGDKPTFTHAIFTRNEEQPPGEGESRDLSTQARAEETMRVVDAATKTKVYDAVQPAVEHVRQIAAQASKDGKMCKVLVTGSFHLVGAVLKAIGHVEN